MEGVGEVRGGGVVVVCGVCGLHLANLASKSSGDGTFAFGGSAIAWEQKRINFILICLSHVSPVDRTLHSTTSGPQKSVTFSQNNFSH